MQSLISQPISAGPSAAGARLCVTDRSELAAVASLISGAPVGSQDVIIEVWGQRLKVATVV